MHLLQTLDGKAARSLAALPPPFGPGFSQEQAIAILTLEIHGSSPSDPGPDFCEFIAFSSNKTSLAPRRIIGY